MTWLRMPLSLAKALSQSETLSYGQAFADSIAVSFKFKFWKALSGNASHSQRARWWYLYPTLKCTFQFTANKVLIVRVLAAATEQESLFMSGSPGSPKTYLSKRPRRFPGIQVHPVLTFRELELPARGPWIVLQQSSTSPNSSDCPNSAGHDSHEPLKSYFAWFKFGISNGLKKNRNSTQIMLWFRRL